MDAPYSIAKSVLIALQFLFYVILSSSIPVTLSYYILFFPLTPFLFRFLSPSLPFLFCQVHFHLCLLFPGSLTSASSYGGSGERGRQSGENACVGVCVSWWKPSLLSPMDQGKSPAPSEAGFVTHCHTNTISYCTVVSQLVVSVSQ